MFRFNLVKTIVRNVSEILTILLICTTDKHTEKSTERLLEQTGDKDTERENSQQTRGRGTTKNAHSQTGEAEREKNAKRILAHLFVE